MACERKNKRKAEAAADAEVLAFLRLTQTERNGHVVPRGSYISPRIKGAWQQDQCSNQQQNNSPPGPANGTVQFRLAKYSKKKKPTRSSKGKKEELAGKGCHRFNQDKVLYIPLQIVQLPWVIVAKLTMWEVGWQTKMPSGEICSHFNQ